MADVEFFEMGDGEEFADVLVVQTLAGVFCFSEPLSVIMGWQSGY